MPEGDTIFRAAVRLRAVMSGQTICRAEGVAERVNLDRVTGRRVEAIEARGKHLLIHLDDAHAIHSHLGMDGSWHVYPLDSRWPGRLGRRRPELVLELARSVCVCFAPKTLELLSPIAIRRHAYLTRLGPDLLAERFCMDEALARLRTMPALPIGEAVMNQTLVCGIGNVYKSEILFLERIDPFQPLDQLADDQLRRLLERARRLMRRNLTDAHRSTRFGRDGPRLWVYGREREPCLECGTPICVRRQGDLGRITFWCPVCQPQRSAS
jgi:endonuclease-8